MRPWPAALVLCTALSALAALPTPPKTHVRAEQLAHDFVYAYGHGVEGGMEGDAVTRKKLTDAGYTVREGLNDTLLDARGDTFEYQAGFAAMVVERPDTNELFFVFRGTDESLLTGRDSNDYANPDRKGNAEVAVGKRQYAKFKAQLDALAKKYAGSGRKVVVTGHSLGGALAQRFTADHPELVNEMVLFQSPGIEQEAWQKGLAYKQSGGRVPEATLYVAEWDRVSDFGYGHLFNPKVVVGTFEGVGKAGAGVSHSGMLVQAEDARSPNGPGARYTDTARVKSRKTVPYNEYWKQRGYGGALASLADQAGNTYRNGSYDIVANGYSFSLNLKFEGASFSGTTSYGEAVTNGSLSGGSIRFTRACPGFVPPTQEYVGVIEGRIAKGTFTGAGGEPGQSYKWEMELGTPVKF